MKYLVVTIILTFTLNLFSQDSLRVDVYNKGILTLTFNGTDPKNSLIKNLDTNVDNWLFVNLQKREIVDSIQLRFYKIAFFITKLVVIINDNADTIQIDSIFLSIDLADSLKSFALTTIDNVSSPTIDSISFFKNGNPIPLKIIHKKRIDDPSVCSFHDKMNLQLKKLKSKEIEVAEKYYNRHFKKHLSIIQKTEVHKLFVNYYSDPINELFKLVVSYAEEYKNQASDLLYGREYLNWSVRKRNSQAKKKYLKAANLYDYAFKLTSTNNENEIAYAAVECYNESERFDLAEDILNSFIKAKEFDYQFFDYYFKTKNKVAQIKIIRENRMLYEFCGGSEDMIDPEHYRRKIFLSNVTLLYKEKNYDVLIEYFKKSCVKINWSEDARLNNINRVICQMLIKTLLKKYSINSIQNEFNKNEFFENQLDPYYQCNDIISPYKTLKIFEIPLNICKDYPSLMLPFHKEKNSLPMIDFENSNENYKEKTIVYSIIQEMVSKINP